MVVVPMAGGMGLDPVDGAYLAAGSYSDQTRLNSSRWWGPRMLQSRVK